MVKIIEAVDKAKDLVSAALEEQKHNIEKGWINTEENQAFVINMKIKFLPKENDDIKVKIPYSFVIETIKDMIEGMVTDQLPLPEGNDNSNSDEDNKDNE